MECQMLDIYLDTVRDLSKGKTNKSSRQSMYGFTCERERDVEIEENQNGEV